MMIGLGKMNSREEAEDDPEDEEEVG